MRAHTIYNITTPSAKRHREPSHIAAQANANEKFVLEGARLSV